MLTPHQEDVLRRLVSIVSYTAPEAIEAKLRMAVAAYVPTGPIAAGSPELDPHADGLQWTHIGECTGTVTYALEVRGKPNADYHSGRLRGTIVRVVDFDDDTALASSMVFLRDVAIHEVSGG